MLNDIGGQALPHMDLAPALEGLNVILWIVIPLHLYEGGVKQLVCPSVMYVRHGNSAKDSCQVAIRRNRGYRQVYECLASTISQYY